MATIRKGDLVQVISGATQDRGGDRGKQGRVIEVLTGKDRVIVEGVNFVTKHVRVGQTQRGTKTGGIETHEAPIHVSNIALVDPDTKQPARVGFKVVTDEKTGEVSRERYFKPSRRAAKPAKKSDTAKKTTTKKATAEQADADSSAAKPSKTNAEDAE